MTTVLPDTVRQDRWIIERAGAETGGYICGWIAMCPAREEGAWFLTHAEALRFVEDSIFRSVFGQRHEDSLARWGVKYEPRDGVEYRIQDLRPPEQPTMRQAVAYLAKTGMRPGLIARELRINRSTVHAHLRHARNEGEI